MKEDPEIPSANDLLIVGVRVQIAWVKYEPYTQHADMSIPDRLATVIAANEKGWLLRDDEGKQHSIEPGSLAASEENPSLGRWQIEGAIPTYSTGDRVLLYWRNRSPAQDPVPKREDCSAIVIADDNPAKVLLRLEDGSEILMYRFGAQADEPDRKAPRWFVADRVHASSLRS